MQTLKEREAFLAARKSYLGASDVASVLNVGNWGCSRKLAYDKNGFQPDFEEEQKRVFSRGHRLEPVAAAYYKDVTGRKLIKPTTKFAVDREFLAANLDRIVISDHREDYGYLEIKVLSRETFKKIQKEGMPDDYILQLQYGMAVSGLKWGAFAVYWADNDELLHWDMEADESLGLQLLDKAEVWWYSSVYGKSIPEALPLGSKACKECVFRVTCRSTNVVDEKEKPVDRPELTGLAHDYLAANEIRKQAEATEKEAKEAFMTAIKNEPGKFACGPFVAKLQAVESNRFDSAALKKVDAKTYETYVKKSTSYRFTVAIKGEENFKGAENE
jgi:putative phage-type endonuclease